MKIKTKLTKIGRNPLKQKGFINPGTYKGSTMIFNTFKDYLNDIKNFQKLINSKTKLIYLESPGTATFDIIDIPFITKIAKKNKIPTVMDNTWASPLFCNPIKLGIDIIIDAGTKYINGHSDVLIGFVSSNKKYSKKIRSTSKTLGICPGSEEVYLAIRGLPTLEIRMREIENNALLMAKYLLEHDLVSDVYHPALPHTKNHKIWKRDFSGSTGLFSFMLKKKYSNWDTVGVDLIVSLHFLH